MSKEGQGSRFKRTISAIGSKVFRANPMGAHVDGPKLSGEDWLRTRKYTKKGSDALNGNEGKPKFDHKWKKDK